MSTVSSRLKKTIEEKDISYAELEKLTGIARSAINRYANGGTNKIPIERVKLLAKALNVDPYYLVWGDTEESKIEIPDDLSESKKEFIRSVIDMPDEKIKALSEMLKAFKETKY